MTLYRKRILFLLQLPPPVHGASVVNKSIQDSEPVNSYFETQYVDISPAYDMADIGKFSLLKAWRTFTIYFRSVVKYIRIKPHLVYMTLSPHGLAFYKDGLLALLLKSLGAEMVFHMHGKGVKQNARGSRFKKVVYRSVFKNANVLHLSECLFCDLDSVRDKKKLILPVPNSTRQFSRARADSSGTAIRFIFLSNFMPSKGADILVRAAQSIPDEYQSKFTLTLIGSANDKDFYTELSRLVLASKFNNIHLLKAKYGVEKDVALSKADIFVLPTRNDCFPLSILEAMSAGLGVISTYEGAIPDIVDHGVTGELLKTCTEESVARAMLRFINNPSYAKACGAAGLAKYAANYTAEEFEKNIIAALDRIISYNLARGNK